MTTAVPTVTRLRAERTREPFVATPTPRLSWQVTTSEPGWSQSRAELSLQVIGRDAPEQTVTLQTGESVFLDWPFDPLPADTDAVVRVRVTGAGAGADSEGVTGPWSDGLSVRTGVAGFGTRESMITVAPADADATAVQEYRTTVALASAPVKATLTITARGVYEASLGGSTVGDEHLAPGWTAYQDRLLFQIHDVTDLLAAGETELRVLVAAGWWGERYGFFGRTSRAYDGPLGVLARLTAHLTDGSVIEVGTDTGWQGRTTGHGWTEASIYHGESRDLTAVDESVGWGAVSLIEGVDAAVLAPAAVEPVRTIAVLAVPLRRTPSGRLIGDVGANIVGVARLSAPASALPRGSVVTLRHCEELDEHGEPAYGPLRTARATDRVVVGDDGLRSWAPRFTFHGFRYVELEGWPDEDTEATVEAEFWHTDAEPTGSFDCSDELVNRLWDNTVRSLRGNIVSVPTDCPQRDERLGWTGDLQVFAPAATGMYDVDGLVASWLADLAHEQAREGGIVPVIVPTVLAGHTACVAGWGDVATVAPWVLWERFGDRTVLAEQYASMQAWVDAVAARLSPNALWDTGMQIGDHLAPGASPWFPGSAPTDSTLLATAYFVRSARIVADTAGLLGRTDDARRYADLAERSREALVAEFVTPAGRVVSDALTACALCIVFDLVPRETKQAMGIRLAQLVAELDFRIGTGFLGTPLLMDALVTTGQADTAARLLTQTACPSWLYPVTQGATTIWERWDVRLPDGTIPAQDAASFNHYALGAVTDWLQRGLAGLAPGAAGYRVVDVRPCLLDGFTHAKASVLSPYGYTAVAWEREGDREGETVRVVADIPPNATARVYLPDGRPVLEVGSGHHEWLVTEAPTASSPGPVSVSAPLEQVVRDSEARDLIVAALRAHDPHRAGAFEGAMAWRTGVPLEAALMFVHPDAMREITEGLAALTRRRDAS